MFIGVLVIDLFVSLSLISEHSGCFKVNPQIYQSTASLCRNLKWCLDNQIVLVLFSQALEISASAPIQSG